MHLPSDIAPIIFGKTSASGVVCSLFCTISLSYDLSIRQAAIAILIGNDSKNYIHGLPTTSKAFCNPTQIIVLNSRPDDPGPLIDADC